MCAILPRNPVPESGLNPGFSMSPFISFEGLDGCGKTTQVRLLADYLTQRDIQVAVLREPGGTPVGEAIRALLLSSRNRGLLPLSELLLYYAARNQNLHRQIIPAQAEGKWVLCDRFADASAAYQGYGRGLDLSVVETLDHMVVDGTKPDLTLLIDIEPSLSLARARERNRRTGPLSWTKADSRRSHWHSSVGSGKDTCSLQPGNPAGSGS